MTSYYSFPPDDETPSIIPGSTHSLYNYLFKVQSTYTSGQVPKWMGYPFSTDSAYSEGTYTGHNDTNYMQFHDGSSVLKMGDIMYGSLKFNDGGGTTNIEIFRSDGGDDYSSYFAGKVTSLKTEGSDHDRTLATKSYYDEIGAELEATIQEYKDIVETPGLFSMPTDWTSAVPASQTYSDAVAYGGDKFVAVGLRAVNYSFDGITWVNVPVPSSASSTWWRGVVYGNGQFVAVAHNATTGADRIMHSPDGITWTYQAAPRDNKWRSITYGNGKFVAVSEDGYDRVMYSSDAITWTSAEAAADEKWASVTYGDGKFVAVAWSGTDRVMHSTDGVSWTLASAAIGANWNSIAYGNGKFVSITGAGASTPRVQWSTDGIDWVLATAANQNDWATITFGNGKFVAIAHSDDHGDTVMYSTNAVDWTAATAAENAIWMYVTHGDNKFVAVGRNSSFESRIMYSSIA